jgi:hypothetical protein
LAKGRTIKYLSGVGLGNFFVHDFFSYLNSWQDYFFLLHFFASFFFMEDLKHFSGSLATGGRGGGSNRSSEFSEIVPLKIFVVSAIFHVFQHHGLCEVENI